MACPNYEASSRHYSTDGTECENCRFLSRSLIKCLHFAPQGVRIRRFPIIQRDKQGHPEPEVSQ